MLLEMAVQIICQSSKKTPEEGGPWLRCCCSGWQLTQQQEVGRWQTHKADVLLSFSIWMRALVLLLFPSHTGRKCQWYIFIRMNRTLDRGKAIATYWKPRVNEKPNTVLIALWESDGTIICSASVFFLKKDSFVDRIEGNHHILTCINNTGIKRVNNYYFLSLLCTRLSVISSPPFPLFLTSFFPLLSPLATVHQSEWPPHCSLQTPSMLLSQRICACYSLCLEFSSSTCVHGLLCHFNKSPLKFISEERPCLATLIPSGIFGYSLAFYSAFVSLHSPLCHRTIKHTFLYFPD